MIEAVEKGSRAERLGLERFDVLVEFNGLEISSPEDVSAALKSAEGGKATARVLHRAQPVTLHEAEGAGK